MKGIDFQYTIGEVLDKVKGLSDLLFCLSAGIQFGVETRQECLKLLATITESIEDDLECVLKAE